MVLRSPACALSTTIDKLEAMEARVQALEAKAAVIRVAREDFGKHEGRSVEKFTLSNGTCSAEVISYGATLISFKAPDKNGVTGECTINYDTLQGVVNGDSYYGATCGRVANRIEKGKFSLEGKEYTLAVNNGPNALHGGLKGFDKVVWNAEPVQTANSAGVKLTYVSKDGEEGYPGTLTAEVTVSLDASNALTFDYKCTTDAPTPLNITNHAYWNLSGEGKRSILTQEAKLYCSKYTPADPTAIPLGQTAPVSGPYDLTEMTLLAKKVPHAGALLIAPSCILYCFPA
jgi:aldose 1-epimerase